MLHLDSLNRTRVTNLEKPIDQVGDSESSQQISCQIDEHQVLTLDRNLTELQRRHALVSVEWATIATDEAMKNINRAGPPIDWWDTWMDTMTANLGACGWGTSYRESRSNDQSRTAEVGVFKAAVSALISVVSGNFLTELKALGKLLEDRPENTFKLIGKGEISINANHVIHGIVRADENGNVCLTFAAHHLCLESDIKTYLELIKVSKNKAFLWYKIRHIEASYRDPERRKKDTESIEEELRKLQQKRRSGTPPFSEDSAVA